MNGPGALSRPYDNDDSPDTMLQDDHDDHHHHEQDDRLGRGDQPHKRSKENAELSDEESKWIHRDKLAKIESEELQAAGIILPHSRSRSRPRRERSQSSTKRMGPDHHTRSRKNSSHALEPKTPETSAALNGAEDGDADIPARPLTGSRIPVPKKSPLPISAAQSRENSPEEQEKRIEPVRTRPRSNSTTLKGLEPSATLKAQPAKRAATDISPKKPTVTVPRKQSAPAKTIPPEARGKVKPKGKNGSNGSSNARPSTRSGERELSTGSWGSKPMEGEPPWMISAYKPDPRLPPDQQLLPTVAKRLQQEKWEQEGKFGSVYDKDFRPLTDEGFLTPPATMPSSSSTDNIIKQEVEKPEEWPLRSPEAPKSPASIGRSSTYSTMPKIQDKPPTSSPLPSPKPPPQAVMPSPPPRLQPTQITRVPDVSEKEDPKDTKKKSGGCGCCVVM